MGDISPKSGCDLAAKILESHPNDAIETLLKYSNGAECDWLEFKAGMALLPEDVAKGDKPDDLYWDYLLSIVAMANTRGGAFVIGVNDKTHEAVPLSSCDPRHVIEKEGKEAYLRKEVLDRFDRSDRKWTTKDRVVWSLPTSIVPFLDKRIMPYRGTDVIVLLVSPRKIGEELFVISKTSLGEFEHLPIRDMGEVGHVKRLTKDREFASHRACRGEQLLTSQLGTWWAELDAEQQASKADEILDDAIRAYHAKLEEETRKKLRAFIPLDVEGDEPDEEDDEEFENPQAISVFDEDDDAWLNSNNKDGGTSDKGSKGLEVEDDSVESEDDDESDDDEEEPSKRIIKIGLYELLEQQNRVVLVGEPGAGKTTCLAHFAVQQGKIGRPRPHLFALIALGRWVDGGSVRGLVEKTCGISQAQIDALLAEKRLHLILDALNECPDRLRPGAMENIRILLRDHPDLPVVLSSRKAEGRKLSGIPVFEVQSMDTDRQRLFLERYLHDADAAQKILDSLLKQPGGASIAQNPMLLRMVVDVVRTNGDLPTGRASLYRRWLENWYAREEKKANKAKDVLPWSKAESIRLLSQMAFAGRAEGYRDIPLDMARHSLGDKDGTFLDRLCQGPLLEIDEGFVHFRHETIQEYLCAEWLLAEPAALNSLLEKDYDTWGMPIAYAAELSLPNKLPEEMSEAVWEMNPWVAALVAASPSIKFDIGAEKRPELILSNAIYHKTHLLSDELRESFSQELDMGGLFKQENIPLSYIIQLTEELREIWDTFECAYILNIPSTFKGDCFAHARRNFRDPWRKVWWRVEMGKILILSRGSIFHFARKHFPEVTIGRIVQGWFCFFQNTMGGSLLRELAECVARYTELRPLPIEALPALLPRLTGGRKSLGKQFNALVSLFGLRYIQEALDAIPQDPTSWMVSHVFEFLIYARRKGYSIKEAAISGIVRLAEEIEDAGVSPSVYETKAIADLCHLLSTSEIQLLMQSLSLFGRVLLRQLGFNIGEQCTQFYSDLLDISLPDIQHVDSGDITIRRKIVLFLLAQEFQVLLTHVGRGVILWNENFPAGILIDAINSTKKQLRACARGSPQCRVRMAIGGNESEGGYYLLLEKIRPDYSDFPPTLWGAGSHEVEHASILQENTKKGSVKLLSTPRMKIAKPILSNTNTALHSLNLNALANGVNLEKKCDGVEKVTLTDFYCMLDLNDPARRRCIEDELRGISWEMKICRLSKHGGRLGFYHPSFNEKLFCSAMSTKYADVFVIGQQWSVIVGVKKKYGVFRFVPESIEPSKENPACPFREKKPDNKCANQISESPDNQNDCASPTGPLGSTYLKRDLSDSAKREHVKSELKAARWEMKVAFISEDQGYLFFSHPSFPDGVYCPALSTQYQDVFEVGQMWNVKVCVKQNKKDGSFGFVARSVKPTEVNPACTPRNRSWSRSKSNKIIIEHTQEKLSLVPTPDSESHISIYIDETWPGTQDHAYENIGVIGGIVVPWEGVDEKRLPVIKTHLDNGSAARNAIQTMLRQSTVFPFVFPIKWDHAVGAGGRRYFELVQHALMLLLGWMLPQRDQPTTVDVFLEHISGYMDGHDETDFISSLTQAMCLLSGGRRFANWQIRRVEWVDKEFGYVPYGDLVCKTCVPREEQQLLAREVKVREWEGFLPFSKDVFPLLRDMDTASPLGLADLLISFAKVAEDTPFFRRVRKIAIDRAKADEAVCTALISRFEECYARPDRDMALLNRVVPHFLNEFPPDLFKDRPRLQLLRILIGFQHANHNGDPDLATALVDQYHSLRPRILELDRDLCAYADLNLAVHHHDSFQFDNALSLVDGWIDDPLFPALSAMNRGRMYSSRGQSLALLGRNQEADEAFARALSIFSAEPELLASDIAQTKTYQAMNALDHDAPSAVPLVEGLLGKSLIATALNLTALLEKPFAAHLFLKTLWRMREGRSVVLDALIKNLPVDIAFRKQHPYELILFYLALLTKEANPSYAKACVREMEQFFEAIEFGGTLGLIHAYMREMLKRHGLNVATDKDFLEELDIVEQYLPKAGTIINEFRMRWGNPSMSIDGILPFNYC